MRNIVGISKFLLARTSKKFRNSFTNSDKPSAEHRFHCKMRKACCNLGFITIYIQNTTSWQPLETCST